MPSVLLLPTLSAEQGRVYLENQGLIALEIEDHIETDDWTLLTDVPGYSGAGFYRWDGPNLFLQPGSGVLRYEVEVTHPGEYQVRIHNYHGFLRPDEHNDVWIRINEGEWIKIYNHLTFAWNWISHPEGAHHHPGWNALHEGRNVIELAGRSNGFAIDRLHLFRPDLRTAEEVEDTTIPLSTVIWPERPLSARFVPQPNLGAAPLRVTLNPNLATVPEGRTIASVQWEIGDRGARSMDETVTFQYDLPGDYPIILTLTDDLGNTVVHSTVVRVDRGVNRDLFVHEASASDHWGGDRISKILDENEKTRWSTDQVGAWAQFDLGGIMDVTGVELAFFKGDERVYTFSVETSRDGETFTPFLTSVQTDGASEEYVAYRADTVARARYVRVIGQGNSDNAFTQITRARILGMNARQGWLRSAQTSDAWLNDPAIGWISLAHYPLAFHPVHRWLYPADHTTETTWIFNLVRNAWTFYDSTLFPWVYDASRATWIFVTEQVETDGTRWFYRADVQEWFLD